MRRDERFMVVLFCPRTRRIASENVATCLWRVSPPDGPQGRGYSDFVPE